MSAKNESHPVPRPVPLLLRLPSLLILSAIVFPISGALVYRVSHFPNLPAIEEPLDFERQEIPELPADENAFSAYEPVLKKMLDDQGLPTRTEAFEIYRSHGWLAASKFAEPWLEQHRDLMGKWRRGTELDQASLVGEIWGDHSKEQALWRLCHLAVVQAGKCRHRGNVEGAWDWLLATMRFSRHLSCPGPCIARVTSRTFHRIAAEQMVEWACCNRVKAKHLKKALQDCRDAYAMTGRISEVLKSNYLEVSTRLNSPYAGASPVIVRRHPYSLPVAFWLHGEPDSALHLLRHSYHNLLSQCDLPRWERTPYVGLRLYRPNCENEVKLVLPSDIESQVRKSILFRRSFNGPSLIDCCDFERALQQSLELVFCMELFRRKYGGYPESLDLLVPEFVAEIPRDVFGEVEEDRMLMLEGIVQKYVRNVDGTTGTEESIGLMIYSRGPNGMDELGPTGFDPRNDDSGLVIPFH